MFKWHVHSAISRGRPVAIDLSKAVDGIAASLRQFSVSASRSAEDDGPARSRAPRATDTFNEVSSLQPKASYGVDARSLAAKPPTTFTIRRLDDRPMSQTIFRGNSRGGARGGSAFRGRGGMDSRGGGRGGARGGRGGRVARGGRGVRAPRGKRAPRQKVSEDDFLQDPYTEEETAYLEGSGGGFEIPYDPLTSFADLANWGPPAISSVRGIKENLTNRMATAIGGDFRANQFTYGREHIMNMSRGGATLFENAQQKAITQKWWKKDPESADAIGDMSIQRMTKKGQLGTLSEKDQKEIMNQWVAGHYTAPKSPETGAVTSYLESFARRNETYLPADTKRFEETFETLLPAALKPKPKPKPGSIKAPL